MKFKEIRKAALKKWLLETKRVRQIENDNFNKSYECNWQRRFRQNIPQKHCSIFCSIGNWNTNITDYLTDLRFDNLDLENEKDKDVLFRHYTKILLTASEIITDFQDILSTFRRGQLLADKVLNEEKSTSRNILDFNSKEGDIQRLFTFINNICKHKINNMHVCNHHLHIYFEENNSENKSTNTIRINNVDLFISKRVSIKPDKLADTIEMPSLDYIITKIIQCYQIIDQTLLSDSFKFRTFCKLYLGESIR